MGYTHYYRFLKSEEVIENAYFPIAKELFLGAFPFLPKECQDIKGKDGYGEPVITNEEICFNGNAEKGENYETFRLRPDMKSIQYCKTGRHAYDAAVCLCLIAFMALYSDYNFRFDSDGQFFEEGEGDCPRPVDEGWKVAKQAFRDYLKSQGVKIPLYKGWRLDTNV